MAYQGVRLRENLRAAVCLALAASCGGKYSNDATVHSAATGGTLGITTIADGGVSGTRPATTAGGGATGGVNPGTTGGASSPGTGGKSSLGGAASTGGKPNVGGATAIGGIASTGGNSGVGGAIGTGGKSLVGGTTGIGGAIATGGISFAGGSAGVGGALVTGGLSSSGGSTSPVDAGSILNDFCTGTQSKVLYRNQEVLAPATSFESALVMDCCNAYGVNLHTVGTLGFELVIDTIWSVGGSIGLGVFTVGNSVQPMRAVVHSSTGTPTSSRVTAEGTANLITSFSYQDPFDLGLCLDLEATQTLLWGTLIYVPKVTIASFGSRNRLQIFLLNDSTVTPTQASAQPLDSLTLAPYPLLDLGKIAYVTSATDEIGLNPGAKIGDGLLVQLSGISMGVPFVVMADGARIFLGTFVSPVSSMIYPGPIIPMETIGPDSMRFAPPGTGTDPLKDTRIVKALTETGKLIP